MKKTLLTLVLWLNASLLFGQVIEKDRRILGGTVNLGFNHSQADTATSSEPSTKTGNIYINLSPSFGKAMKNNLVFGYLTSLGYSHNKSEDLRVQQSAESNGYAIGAGVFLEKYFPLTRSLSFSGMMPLQFNYGSYQNKLTQNGTLLSTDTGKSYGVNLSLYPSLNYSLNRKFILQLTLNNFVSFGYMHSTHESEGTNVTPIKLENTLVGFNTRVNESTRLSDIGFAFRYIF